MKELMFDMSEIASGTSSFASAKRKPAISEHDQNNTPLALASGGCFDTSVYGELLDDEASLRKVAEQVNAHFMVFGSSTVRKELEETPSVTLVTRGKFKGLNLRELLLQVYRFFVEGSGGEVLVTDLVEVLALRYLLEYEKLESKEAGRMLNDFRIVAAASLHWIGIFISADKAQLSAKCASVYSMVNMSYQLSVPMLVLYLDFSKAPKNYAGLEEA